MVLLMVMTGAAGCAQHSAPSLNAQDLRYDQSVTGLMKYCAHMATLSGDMYSAELQKAFREHARKSSDFSTLRLAIALMNNNVAEATTQYAQAERLLAEHLDRSSPGYFERDYRPLAQFLLRMNREWQKMNTELAATRLAKARAERQVEELKSIEIRMNSSGNSFH